MLSTKQVLDIIVWYNRRFEENPAKSIGYFSEWLERFDRSQEAFLAHMDDTSKSIWLEVLNPVC